ncbi:unnamed protein product [Pelagomonas calceolata]|uniref:Uncharacterized protein n=1 Tax=Pelagomonas calceolata TaxID=35677 RepID=A0A8J2SBJ1_9STRA|nr:unnamed protein product [Pelagomonas calceolata]
MGRNKWHRSLTKAERKRAKEGTTLFHSNNKGEETEQRVVNDGLVRAGTVRRRRSHSQTSNNSWVHAVGFVILAAIVISWALGY